MTLVLWNIATERISLWIRWIHGKYLAGGHMVWSIRPHPNDSWVWKRLISHREVIQPYISFDIGEGSKVRL